MTGPPAPSPQSLQTFRFSFFCWEVGEGGAARPAPQNHRKHCDFLECLGRWEMTEAPPPKSWKHSAFYSFLGRWEVMGRPAPLPKSLKILWFPLLFGEVGGDREHRPTPEIIERTTVPQSFLGGGRWRGASPHSQNH